MPDTFDKVALEYDFFESLFYDGQFILDHLSHHRRFALDIGCSSGHLVETLSGYYQMVIGIDIAEVSLQIAKMQRTTNNSYYVCMNAESLALNTKFDLVVCQNILHHVINQAQVIEKIKRLLAPMGKLIISDVISENPTPATWIYWIGALQELLPNISQYGWQIAWRVFRFRTSRHWLYHLSQDVYLSKSQFRQLYAHHLPSCNFLSDNTLIWQKPIE